jgi:hypothetical protein
MEDTSGRFWQSLFMVSNGTGFAGSHDCGTLVDPMATLLNANGDVVSAMLITEFRKGRSGFQTR